MYEYSCRLIRVINGNTIEADIDLGFEINIKQKIRLYGVEATEVGKAALIAAIPQTFLVQTIYSKRGKVGRVLGVIYLVGEDGSYININESLIDTGIVKKYDI